MKRMIATLIIICLLLMSVAVSEETEVADVLEVEESSEAIEFDIEAEIDESLPEDPSYLELPGDLVLISEEAGQNLDLQTNTEANTVGTEINETNFPDDSFRAYVMSECDSDSDGYLSDTEVKAIKRIDVDEMGISTLEGIEFFTSLEELTCDSNQLKELDVSRNNNLTELECNDNQLRYLTIGDKRYLETLLCWNNQLMELNISGCPALDFLHCKGNRFDVLDFSGNPKLVKIVCEYGPCFNYGEIEFLSPNDWGQSDETALSYDRRIRIYSDGKLLYSPDKPIQRKLEPVTIGLGESDDGIMYNVETGSYTPIWIIQLLSNGKNTYKSSKSAVVKVNSKKGSVKGNRTGKATVTVVSSFGVEISRQVNVKKAPSRVSLSKSSITLREEDEKEIKVKLPSGTASRNLVWTSSNPDVAEYKEDYGIIRAYHAGTAEITVKTYNGKKASCKVKVTNPDSDALDLRTDKLYLSIGETFQLIPVIDDGSKASFTYAAGNKKIATVSSKGIITAKKKGTTEITVKASNGMMNYVTVSVSKKLDISSPYKSGKSGIRVYATSGSKYFHSKSNCSGLTGASRITLETALNYGKKPCPVCLAAAATTVYAFPGGYYYHTSKKHAGNRAKGNTLAVAKACEMSACPVCCG